MSHTHSHTRDASGISTILSIALPTGMDTTDFRKLLRRFDANVHQALDLFEDEGTVAARRIADDLEADFVALRCVLTKAINQLR